MHTVYVPSCHLTTFSRALRLETLGASPHPPLPPKRFQLKPKALHLWIPWRDPAQRRLRCAISAFFPPLVFDRWPFFFYFSFRFIYFLFFFHPSDSCNRQSGLWNWMCRNEPTLLFLVSHLSLSTVVYFFWESFATVALTLNYPHSLNAFPPFFQQHLSPAMFFYKFFSFLVLWARFFIHFFAFRATNVASLFRRGQVTLFFGHVVNGMRMKVFSYF